MYRGSSALHGRKERRVPLPQFGGKYCLRDTARADITYVISRARYLSFPADSEVGYICAGKRATAADERLTLFRSSPRSCRRGAPVVGRCHWSKARERISRGRVINLYLLPGVNVRGIDFGDDCNFAPPGVVSPHVRANTCIRVPGAEEARRREEERER
jgi:hypothetical protein